MLEHLQLIKDSLQIEPMTRTFEGPHYNYLKYHVTDSKVYNPEDTHTLFSYAKEGSIFSFTNPNCDRWDDNIQTLNKNTNTAILGKQLFFKFCYKVGDIDLMHMRGYSKRKVDTLLIGYSIASTSAKINPTSVLLFNNVKEFYSINRQRPRRPLGDIGEKGYVAFKYLDTIDGIMPGHKLR
mgnify:CR=1 FL=1